jgi:hypothetical protein
VGVPCESNEPPTAIPIMNANYKHTQHSPLCLLIYGFAVMFLALSWVLCNEVIVQLVVLAVGVLMLVLAASFHHLTVEDEGDAFSLKNLYLEMGTNSPTRRNT